MSDQQGQTDDPREEEEEEEFPLCPPEPTAADYRPEVLPLYREEVDGKPEGEKRFQFTIGELLGLTGGLAVLLAILGCIPGGYSAAGIAGVAGIAGIGLLASLIVLTLAKPSRPILYVAWWILLGVYVTASLVAVVWSLL